MGWNKYIRRTLTRNRLLLLFGFVLGVAALVAESGKASDWESKTRRVYDWGFEPAPDAELFKRWPDAKSCLPLEEQGKDKPNLANFDWSSIKDDDQARVCLFRIASEIGDPNAMAEWFRAFGLKTYPPVQYSPGLVRYDVVWSMRGGRWPLFPGGLSISNILKRIFSHGHGISTYWGSDGKIRGVLIGVHTYE